jgi:PAS domain S-box-containing protein
VEDRRPTKGDVSCCDMKPSPRRNSLSPSPEHAVRHLAALVESSDDAIASKTLDGIVITWNRAAERLFGYTAEEMVGQSIRRIIPPDRQHEEDETLARIRRGERLEHFETWRLRKDGSLVPISLTVSPIVDEHGTVVAASKIARDISDRQRMDDERTRLLAMAQEHADVTEKLNNVGRALSSALDPETVVQAVTDAATNLTGAEFGAFFYNVADPATGGSYMLYTLSGAPKSAFARFPHPRATALFGPTFRGEGVVRLDDVAADPRFGRNAPYFGMPAGHLPVRSYLAVPVRNRSQEVLGGLFFGHSRVGVFTDASERLATGIALWATVALANAKLYADVDEANRLKDEFLATLSHELRTPLNAIVGYVRMIRAGFVTGDRLTAAVETIDRNASSLTQIVEDILDVSRIISGKIRLDVRPVDLPSIVHDAIDTVHPAAEGKGVRLEAIIDPRAAPVSGDPERLRQILWNLLNNAVKFTPRGGKVQVRVERVDSHIDVVVSDTGVGIPKSFLPHVFERFRQADASINRPVGGLGLGLAIVRHLAELHGGSVSAASEGEGHGATFRVHLPIMVAAPDRRVGLREHPVARTAGAPLIAPDLNGVRIVIVDDDADARSLIRDILETTGATVRVGDSADAALALLHADPPDILLADIGMPIVDGFELIKRVRDSQDARVRTVAAAALTAYARSEDRARALQQGFHLHLSKPIEPSELLAAMSALARRHRTWRSS